MTSHLDIPGTPLPLLGVTSQMSDYTLGGDLFDHPSGTQLLGSYTHLCLLDERYKLMFPFKGGGYFHYVVRTKQDELVSKEDKQQHN